MLLEAQSMLAHMALLLTLCSTCMIYIVKYLSMSAIDIRLRFNELEITSTFFKILFALLQNVITVRLVTVTREQQICSKAMAVQPTSHQVSKLALATGLGIRILQLNTLTSTCSTLTEIHFLLYYANHIIVRPCQL